MSVTYGFYNSVGGDRRYDATQMSDIFDGVINDGVFGSVGDALIVEAAGGMNVGVGIGRAWFNKTWTNNDSILVLSLDAAGVGLSRIDAVVLEVNTDVDVRMNAIKVVKGTPSVTPVEPTMESSEFLHQYPLCYISVDAGVTEISQANITNTIGTSECPLVTGILETISIDDLLLQWEAEFQAWFDTLGDILDENVAANLLNMINITNNKLSLTNSTFTTTGSANAYLVTIPNITSMSDLIGVSLKIKANFANTGACTLKANSYTAYAIRKDSIVPMALGDIENEQIVEVVWDGTYYQFIGSDATISGKVTNLETFQTNATAQLEALKYQPNTGTANAIVVAKAGFTLANGNYVEWYQAAANTTAVTINAEGTGVKSLKATDGTALISGDLAIGYYRAVYDTASGFFLLAPRGGAKINGSTKTTETILAGDTVVVGDLVEYFNGNKVGTRKTRALGRRIAQLSSATSVQQGNQPKARVLSSNSFILVHTNFENYLCARVVTISGSTITLGTSVNLFYASSSDFPEVVVLSATSAVAFARSSSSLYCVAMTISGSTITAGSQTSVASVYASYKSYAATKLTATSLVVSYGRSNSNYVYSMVLTVSGTTVTANTEYSATETYNLGSMRVTTLDTTRAVVSYYSGSGYYVARVISVSGTVITFGATTSIVGGGGGNAFGQAFAMNSTTIMAVYVDNAVNGNTGAMYAGIWTVSGTTITYNAFVQIALGYKWDPSLAEPSSIDPNTVCLVLQGQSNYSANTAPLIFISYKHDGTGYKFYLTAPSIPAPPTSNNEFYASGDFDPINSTFLSMKVSGTTYLLLNLHEVVRPTYGLALSGGSGGATINILKF